jgi:hypothetical protein
MIPAKCDIVIIISSQVSHSLQSHAKSQAGKMGVPIVYVSHNASVFPEQLKKWGVELAPEQAKAKEVQLVAAEERTTPMYQPQPTPTVTWQEAVAQISNKTPALVEQIPEASQQPTIQGDVDKETLVAKEAKKLRSNQVRANEKVEYLKELLREDPAAPPNELIAKIQERFPGKHEDRPGGMAKTLITKVRWDEHGIRIGPGGRIFDKKGKRVEELEKPRVYKARQGKENGSESPIKNGHAPIQGPDAVANDETVFKHPVGLPRVQRSPEANAEASNDRLKQLVAQLRTVMQDEGLQDISIPLIGAVKAKRAMEVNLSI